MKFSMVIIREPSTQCLNVYFNFNAYRGHRQCQAIKLFRNSFFSGDFDLDDL